MNYIKLGVLLIVMFVGNRLVSQKAVFVGVKSGLTLANMHFEKADEQLPFNLFVSDMNPNVAFAYSFFSEFRLAKRLYFRSEVEIITARTKLNSYGLEYGRDWFESDNGNLKLNYYSVPFYLQIKLGKKAQYFFNIGSYLSYVHAANISGSGVYHVEGSMVYVPDEVTSWPEDINEEFSMYLKYPFWGLGLVFAYEFPIFNDAFLQAGLEAKADITNNQFEMEDWRNMHDRFNTYLNFTVAIKYSL